MDDPRTRPCRQMLQRLSAAGEQVAAAVPSNKGEPSGERDLGLQTSSLRLDMLRDLKRINAHIVSVAHPIMDEHRLLAESRLREAVS